MDKLTLTTEQRVAADQILAHKATLVGAAMGTGKTVLLTTVILESWSVRSLVIGPKNVWDNWAATLEAQSDGTDFLKVCSKKNKDQKQNLDDLLDGKTPGHYFIGRELFTSLDWYTKEDNRGRKKRVQRHIWKSKNLDVAVFDEVHAAASAKSRASKSWADIVPRDHKVGQSATWYGSKFENAYTVVNGLWPGFNPKSFPLWVEKWCNTEYDHFSWYKKKVTGERNPGEYVRTLPSYVYIESDISQPEFEYRWVDLSREQRRVYDMFQKNQAVKLGNDWMVGKLPVETRVRLRQLTLGEVIVRGDEIDFAVDCKSSKFDELLDILRNDYPDEKVFITCASAKFARVVAEKLNLHFKKEVAGLYAGTEYTSEAARAAVKRDFTEGELKYFVGVIAACSEALDGLQRVCRIGIQLEESENETQNTQLPGRLARRGQERDVVWLKIGARGTYDAGVISRLEDLSRANRESRKR